MTDRSPTAPVTSDVDAVLEWLRRDSTEATTDRNAGALAEALLVEGQKYLADVSSEHDVELFFETFGYFRGVDPVTTATRIVRALEARFPDEVPGLVARSAERARRHLKG